MAASSEPPPLVRVILELAAGLLGVLFLYLVLARLQEVLRSRLSASSVHAAPLLDGSAPSAGDRAFSDAESGSQAGSNAEPAGSPDPWDQSIPTLPLDIVGERDWGDWRTTHQALGVTVGECAGGSVPLQFGVLDVKNDGQVQTVFAGARRPDVSLSASRAPL